MNETPKTIGRYEILTLAGRGAMGAVFRARDPVIGRTVAIKVISPAGGLGSMEAEEFKNRFFREAQAAGNLNHSNIVTIYDVGEADGVPFMAQEFIEGESLTRKMEKGRPMPVADAVGVIRQVAEGLAYAHEHGIVHRDIKPDNILIERNGRAVITDFGIARVSTSDLTRTGEILGTPHYMSPEQVLGRPLDGRSDLFSLGVVFYQLLAGQLPFAGETVTSVCYQIVHESPRPLPNVADIPAPVLQILARMLAKAADDRFPDGKALLEALDPVVHRTRPLREEEKTQFRPGALPSGAPLPSAGTAPSPPPPSTVRPTSRPAPTRGAPPAQPARNLAWLWGLVALVLVALTGLGIWAMRSGVGGPSGAGGGEKKADLPSASAAEPPVAPQPTPPAPAPDAAGSNSASAGPQPVSVPHPPGSGAAAPPPGRPAPGEERPAPPIGLRAEPPPPPEQREENIENEKDRVAGVAGVRFIVRCPYPDAGLRVLVDGVVKLDKPAGMFRPRVPLREHRLLPPAFVLEPGAHDLEFVVDAPYSKFKAQASRSVEARPGEPILFSIAIRPGSSSMEIEEMERDDFRRR